MRHNLGRVVATAAVAAAVPTTRSPPCSIAMPPGTGAR
jgi:hypothetical protein